MGSKKEMPYRKSFIFLERAGNELLQIDTFPNLNHIKTGNDERKF